MFTVEEKKREFQQEEACRSWGKGKGTGDRRAKEKETEDVRREGGGTDEKRGDENKKEEKAFLGLENPDDEERGKR